MPPNNEKFTKKTTRTVSRRACLSCREKKIKCDGVQVCRNCQQLNIECIFVKSHRGGRRNSKQSTTNTPLPVGTGSNVFIAEEPSTSKVPHSISLPSLSDLRPEPYPSRPGVIQHQQAPPTTAVVPPLPLPPHSHPAHHTLPTTPSGSSINTNPTSNEQVTISQLEQKIAVLQHQVDTLTNNTSDTKYTGLGNWEVSERDMNKLDLPGEALSTHMVDLYYTYVHPNHPFLFPRCVFFKYLSVKNDVSLIHAMFSISCRYLPDNFDGRPIYSHMKDPEFWTTKCTRFMDRLTESNQAKTLLLCCLSAFFNLELEQAVNFINQTKSFIHLHRLDKRHQRRQFTNGGRDQQQKSLDILNRHQLIDRESLIRTIWHTWKIELWLAIFTNIKINHSFDSALCLPCSTQIYERELKDWKPRLYFWDQFETDLLSADPNDKSSPLFFDMSFLIGGCQLAGTTSRQVSPENKVRSKSEQDDQMTIKNSILARSKSIYDLIPSEQHDLQINISAVCSLYLSTIMLNGPVVSEAMVFVSKTPGGYYHILSPDATPDEMYWVRSVNDAYQALYNHNAQYSTNAQLAEAFSQCSAVVEGIRRFLLPEQIRDLNKHWDTLPQVLLNLLEFCAVFLSSQVMMNNFGIKTNPAMHQENKNHYKLMSDLNSCVAFMDAHSAHFPKYQQTTIRLHWMVDHVNQSQNF